MPTYKRLPLKEPERKYFTKRQDSIPFPDLVEGQRNSYDWFLKQGIKELFEEISPIKDFSDRHLELYLEDYYLDEPKFNEMICRERNITYEAPLRVNVRLVNTETNQSKTQEIYLGDLPLMTPRGTFMVNGIERVVVSQLIRSSGVFFTKENNRGRNYYGAKIIPNRGAWLEVETDSNNVLWVKIDRKRKVAVTSLMRAFGMEKEEDILAYFKDIDIHPTISYIGETLKKDLAENMGEGLIEVYKRIRPGDLATADNAKSLIYAMFFNFERYDFGAVGAYKFDKKFDLGQKNEDYSQKDNRVFSLEKLLLVIKEVIRLNISQEDADDIDHLGNRRVRAVGELTQNRFRIGMARMERVIKDRMSTYDMEQLAPNKLINARPVISAIREFFMSSQLSQFMDQINVLSELEHKRRLSALGPGGLSRDRAGFEVRDVHNTHYGRICPIATPEGPNIGLVNHLAGFAKINEFGFIETPYRKVDRTKAKPRVTNEVVYLNSFQEEKVVTAPATTKVDDDGYFTEETTPARVYGKPNVATTDRIEYVDVASNQIISVATGMIPFLEHDDATRALMGTNMQRQAVPCIKVEPPLVGTGVEKVAARNSGYIIEADADGEITELSGEKIVLTSKKGETFTYSLKKFLRSNAATCINQHPTINIGDKVKKGDPLTDGPCIKENEVALGQNILVAYMIWDGFNYEDAVIISDRIVKHDRYTSVHIEDYVIDVRETKLGPEMVTSDIPNVSEEKLKNLDSEGIVRIGAEVKSGDILVGKITPKGETELSAEERLLRAIFGEKARDVRDSSLYLEHGEHGKVIDVKIFSAENGDKLEPGVIKQVRIRVADMRKIQVGDKMSGRHGNKGVISRVVPVEDMPFLEDGTPVDIILSPLGVVSRMNLGQLLENHLGLAANALGYKIATPSFDGVSEEQIREELVKAGFTPDGQSKLYDGRTGEVFDNKITVGYNYMLKLNHMVEDKIHQRSIGPYSLITQQPLGGRAQSGGQRFGGMEVWALEAYGAAHILQEILTIKSDDVPGRSKAYEAIIKGEEIRNVNIPESFNVLVREMKGLGLDVELLKRSESGEYRLAEEVLAEEEKLAEENRNENRPDNRRDPGERRHEETNE